jgi:hypothetical protein
MSKDNCDMINLGRWFLDWISDMALLTLAETAIAKNILFII